MMLDKSEVEEAIRDLLDTRVKTAAVLNAFQ